MRLIRDHRHYPVHPQSFTPGLPDMLVHETIPRGQYVPVTMKVCEGLCGRYIFPVEGSTRRVCYDCMRQMPRTRTVRQRATKRGYERKSYGV